jgi:hypothetical protein
MADKTRSGSTERNITVILSEEELIWLVQMMAQVKVNTTCPHCEDEAVDKGCLFLSAISPEAREHAVEVARMGAERVTMMKSMVTSDTIN